MRLTTSLTTAVLTLGASIAAAPLEVRQETLKDWQVSQVIWGGPSSRPGMSLARILEITLTLRTSGSSPFQILTVEVTDPNEINLGPSSADGKDVIVPAEPTFVSLSFFLVLHLSSLREFLPRDSHAKQPGSRKSLLSAARGAAQVANIRLLEVIL